LVLRVGFLFARRCPLSTERVALSEAERNQRVLAAFRILAAAARRKHTEQTGCGNPPPSKFSP
jgi:hypothetical protein